MDADDISPRMENTSSPQVLENMSSAELLDNLSLAQPDNVTWVETVVLVESGVLMGNSTNWRQQLDFPLLQVETHKMRGRIGSFPVLFVSTINKTS